MFVQVGASDLILIAPLIVLFITSLVPITVKVLLGNKEQPLMATVTQALVGVLVALIFVIMQWESGTAYGFAQALIFDGISNWATLMVLLITGVTVLLMHDNLHTKDHQFAEQVALVLSAAVGMLIVAWSNDLIVTFIGIELMSLAIYVVVGLGLEQRLSKEAAFKYFILGSFGSAVLLYGIALIYGTAETTFISKLAESAPALMATNKLFLMGMLMLLAGLAFKISVFPFHAWTPDVYQGAPTPITTFMATGVKLVMFLFFIRVALTGVFTGSEATTDVLEWLAILTIFAGNLAALMQNNFKRMLAYSSIAHTGYLLVGVVAIAISKAPQNSISAVIFYLVTYTIMTFGTFALASLYEKSENASLDVDDLKGLAARRPRLAIGMTVLLLSIAGIPPLAGFFGKMFVFSAAISEGLFWPVVWGVVGSVVGVVYYLRPVVNMYMHDPSARFEEPMKYVPTRLALLASAILVVVVGLAASPVLESIQSSVSRLFN